jgi:hypothetical protein
MLYNKTRSDSIPTWDPIQKSKSMMAYVIIDRLFPLVNNENFLTKNSFFVPFSKEMIYCTNNPYLSNL